MRSKNTITPRVKRLFSIDLLEKEVPDDPHDFWLVMQADIGPPLEEGADTLTFYACSLERLRRVVEAEGWRSGRALLMLPTFTWAAVEQAVTSWCRQSDAETWEQVALKLHQYMEWEAFDLKPAED